MRVTYHAATSLDGYIADEGGGVGWLDEIGIRPAETGFGAFYAEVDGLIMGRATYDFLLQHGSWPYAAQPCWVCTSREAPTLPGCDRRAFTDVRQACRDAEAEGVRNLWVVGGGKLAAAMLDAGLLTHVHLSVTPILLGTGIPVVGPLGAPVRLVQESAREGGGLTEIVYAVARDDAPLTQA